ncbi:glycosyltransferase WbuB [Iodobacter sp. HSC-16F04]|uniref:Glycosyltransferase WbuB n=1 Tax=Iodobacter violaceini TaxID=3044271 RepID=A0ABX0L1F3_9NEIS|nr:glycosyltransferase WbuB [Iodobacter violacea]NHQ88515.1 glycosyltransferase WbuB [Iodobacter violacea]
MKILVYGINYSPEMTGIGKYTGEMAEWLAAQGHEVRVVTAPPYYPQWQVGEGYSAFRYQYEMKAGVKVWRTPLWVPGKLSGAKRLLHLMSFALSSLPVMLRQIFWRPDVVWMAAPALVCAPNSWLTAKLSGAKCCIHIQDYEVDAAFALGLLKNQKARRFALWLERGLLRRFDLVSTISGRMMDLARAKGVDPKKLVFFPNWVKLPPASIVSQRSSYRDHLGIADDAVVALYSGNMGAKQGLEVLADTARALKDLPNIQFVFCGQGPGRAGLERMCAGLSNVRFLDLQPMEQLADFLGLADIHLLPQRADAADLVMPSKLTGMLASGRAVVAGAQPGTELAEVMQGCGLVVQPENAVAMSAAVLSLANDQTLRLNFGMAGRAFADATLDQQVILACFVASLKSVGVVCNLNLEESKLQQNSVVVE